MYVVEEIFMYVYVCACMLLKRFLVTRAKVSNQRCLGVGRVYLSLYVCVYVCMLCIYICVYVCMCVYICVGVCVYVCGCMYMLV